MTEKPPTLTDAVAMGGTIAQHGFDYQLWYVLLHLPAWLRIPAFEGVLVEGLEDFEVRYFSPAAPRQYLLDRFQTKSGALTPAEVKAVFENFRRFTTFNADVARVQTLVCPQLPSSLTWVTRDTKRVQLARPFYAPFPTILEQSDHQLGEDLKGAFGDELGPFVMTGIECVSFIAMDRPAAEAQFAAAIAAAFPAVIPSLHRAAAAFAALKDLFDRHRGRMLTRDEVLQVLEQVFAVPLATPKTLAVQVLAQDEVVAEGRLVIDGRPFSLTTGSYPTADRWADGLKRPLLQTSAWAKSRSISRISLMGAMRLTTAFTCGWAFKSANGFDLEIPTRSAPWKTDDHPTQDAAPIWATVPAARVRDETLTVCIGILRNPMDVVHRQRASAVDDVLSLYRGTALTDGADCQASVRFVKSTIDRYVSQLSPQHIDLYFAGPASFAVALGHRWNALPETTLHEYVAASGSYRKALSV